MWRNSHGRLKRVAPWLFVYLIVDVQLHAAAFPHSVSIIIALSNLLFRDLAFPATQRHGVPVLMRYSNLASTIELVTEIYEGLAQLSFHSR